MYELGGLYPGSFCRVSTPKELTVSIVTHLGLDPASTALVELEQHWGDDLAAA
jgi:hypothetical protein